jgi:hypothetical protein
VESDSRYGPDPVTYRHPLERLALLRRPTRTPEVELE